MSKTDEPRAELEALENRLSQLRRDFPELCRPARVADQYGSPSEKALFTLSSEIEDRKLRLLTATDSGSPSVLESTGRQPKARGRPLENERLYRLVCEKYKESKMRLSPKDLAEHPALKDTLATYVNPANFVSKALMWGRENGLLSK
jgi:hypothetical protein